ncbi:uncharacterized [Tachysurus ichikawai]
MKMQELVLYVRTQAANQWGPGLPGRVRPIKRFHMRTQKRERMRLRERSVSGSRWWNYPVHGLDTGSAKTYRAAVK